MAWDPISKENTIDDVKKDRKNSQSIEKYMVSDQAVYFEGKYLPISIIRSIKVQSSIFTPKGCCGSSIPIYKIGVDYGEEKPLVLMIEKESNVDKFVTNITEKNPSVQVIN